MNVSQTWKVSHCNLFSVYPSSLRLTGFEPWIKRYGRYVYGLYEKTMKKVNSRPVWESSTHDQNIYFGSTKHWYIGSHDDMMVRGWGGFIRSKLKDLIEVPTEPYERLVTSILTNNTTSEWIGSASLIVDIGVGNTIRFDIYITSLYICM